MGTRLSSLDIMIKKSDTGFSQNDHFTFQYEAGVSVFEMPTFTWPYIIACKAVLCLHRHKIMQSHLHCKLTCMAELQLAVGG